MRRLRYLADFNPSSSEIAHLPRNTWVSFLPMESVGEDGGLELNRQRRLSEVMHGYTYLRDGDVAYAKITPCFENGKGALMKGLQNGIAFGTTELTVIRPHQPRLCGEYLYLLISSAPFRKLGEAEMYGAGGQKRVPDDFARDFMAPLPPLPEQLAIVRLLDRECAKIDAMVKEQERLIELLKEKRQGLLSHAVTKGLNANVAVKASGVEAIGDIPVHWRIEKMKWVARMESGHTPDRKVAAYWENCEIPWVSLNDTGYLKDHDYISETTYSINELGIANSSARLLPAGAVVFSRDATIGRCAITTRPMAVSQHFIAWICSDVIVPEYLLFRLRSMTEELEQLTAGATLRTIGMPDVRTLVTPLPPVEEQRQIVDYLRTSITRIDQLISEAERAIGLLAERRKALVAAAISGKIDVRGLVDAAAA